MTNLDPTPTYRVVVSEIVRRHLRELADEAVARGDGPIFVAAVRAFLARLAVYPQFGDPIIDLLQGEGQIRVGIIRPLSMRYGVHEEQRIVFCGALPVLLPISPTE